MGSATELVSTNTGASRGPKLTRWVGMVLLLLVAYIHLALFLRMMAFSPVLGILFVINAAGAFVAAIGVYLNSRWLGWALGILMAGGAAAAKIAMNTVPGFGSLLRGGARGPRGVRPGGGGGAPGGNFGSGSGFRPGAGPHAHVVSGGLPTFTNMATLGTVAIVIELLFVVLAIYALARAKKRRFPSN